MTDNKELELLDPTTPNLRNSVSNIVLRKLKSLGEFTQLSGFTFTFKSKFHSTDDKWLHRHVEEKIKKSHIWSFKNYILIPEFTSKNGNLHYHGVIWNAYDVEVMRCIKWWQTNFGFAKPELNIRNYGNWMTYITKDYLKSGLWTINRWCISDEIKKDLDLTKNVRRV